MREEEVVKADTGFGDGVNGDTSMRCGTEEMQILYVRGCGS